MSTFRRLRNRLLGSPRFQRFAATFPLTRPIARRQSRVLFDLCAGFVYTQVLYACVKLELLTLLELRGPLTLSDLAVELDLPQDRLAVLLRAAVALQLLDRCGADGFDLGARGAMLLGNPGATAMIRHHALFYQDLADPLALLSGGGTDLASYWGYAGSDDPGGLDATAVGAYSELMATSQTLIADLILSAYPCHRHRRLLDLGGGLGAFVAAVAERCPKLALEMLDLPPVAEAARSSLEARGLGDRIDVHGGDAFRDPLPTGADLVTLVRIVHDHDDAAVLALLTRIRAALPASGALLIAEPMAETRGAEAMGDAYFGFYLLAMGSGRPRSRARLEQLLRDAGFRRIREQRTANPLLVRVLVART